jgi:hypothetical protein
MDPQALEKTLSAGLLSVLELRNRRPPLTDLLPAQLETRSDLIGRLGPQ